jgi:cation diffusion facilitator family transporter
VETTVSPSIRRIILAGWVGLVINLCLTAAKLAAGIAGHSQAVIADAVHSLTDIVTDIAVIFGVRYWSAPADESHPHGHGKFETLVTAFIGIMVAVAAVSIGWDAVASFGRPAAPPSVIALVAALLSIVVKEALYRWTRSIARETGSAATLANAWHHRSDAMSSVPVAAAVAVAIVDHRLLVVDRVAALVVALFVLHAAFRIIRPTIDQLVDAGAPRAHRRQLERLALAVDGVESAHALRTRWVGSELAVDLHVEVDPGLSVAEGFEIARRVKRELTARDSSVADVMVQIEPRKPDDDGASTR